MMTERQADQAYIEAERARNMWRVEAAEVAKSLNAAMDALTLPPEGSDHG